MKNKSLGGLFAVLVIIVSRILFSPTIHQMRSVDLLLVFSSGLLAGALLVTLLQRFRSKPAKT